MKEIKLFIKKIKTIKHIVIIFAIGILAAFISGGFVRARIINNKNAKQTLFSQTAFQYLHEINELSTFQNVYNGIAVVMNEKNSDKVDYYVSYISKINTGFDLNDLQIDIEEKNKKIIVTIPDIKIMDVLIDEGSLDYIFINDKANTNTVYEQAFTACKEDVTNEAKDEDEIYQLSRENAKNIIEGLLTPFIQQFDATYTLEIN